MPSSNIGRSRRMASRAFRIVDWFWLVLGFVYSGGYLHLATLDNQLFPGLVLASLLVFQALLIPAYVSRQTFGNATQAIIRSAGAAVALAGIAQCIYALTKGFFAGPHWEQDYGLLAPGYVWTVLILAGLAGGTALGTLRWRTQQAVEHPPITLPPDSRWRRYFQSTVVWLAIQAIAFWLMELLGPRRFQPDSLQVLFSLAGLLLIAPIPLFFSMRSGISRWILAWRYAASIAIVVVTCFVLLIVFVAVARSPNGIILWAAFPFSLIFVWIYCSLWVPLYLWSTPLTSQSSPAENVAVPARFMPALQWMIVSLSVVALFGALPAGLLATSPAALGWNGIGCATSYSSVPFEYWFWKGYKGVSSEVLSGKSVIIRLSLDPSTCISFPAESLNDHEAIDKGYRLAARTWFWLIDPDEWDRGRTKEIRGGLAHLTGHDFSSYEELSSWWEANQEFLTWSAEDQLLETHKTEWQIDHPNGYLPPPVPVLCVVEQLRKRGPVWLYGADPQLNDPLNEFGSAILDREARLRGLKLFVADDIDVLTGERQRQTREYLRSLTGRDYETEDEWWRALNAITVLRNNWNDPRFWEWQSATQRIPDLCLENQHYDHCPIGALKNLKELTGNQFDSPEQWVQWWHDNARRVELSPDGRTLVTRAQ